LHKSQEAPTGHYCLTVQQRSTAMRAATERR